MNTKDRPSALVAYHRLMLIVNEFRKVNAEMTFPQAATLLTIAAEPGLTITEVAKKAGLGLAQCSRHVEVLGPHRPAKNTGLGLVSDDFHPVDRRRKVLTLTPKGQLVVDTLQHIIEK